MAASSLLPVIDNQTLCFKGAARECESLQSLLCDYVQAEIELSRLDQASQSALYGAALTYVHHLRDTVNSRIEALISEQFAKGTQVLIREWQIGGER